MIYTRIAHQTMTTILQLKIAPLCSVCVRVVCAFSDKYM